MHLRNALCAGIGAGTQHVVPNRITLHQDKPNILITHISSLSNPPSLKPCCETDYDRLLHQNIKHPQLLQLHYTTPLLKRRACRLTLALVLPAVGEGSAVL